ncbi:hypothetical protein FGO68_gene4578 [Halteria grandinella]|uniref:Uncharacterized protein n=1 Tax=Halteria grandinella TaxID=5974 RepID=A0A8J8NQ39_HALGN|nr:hypothetical protein FGO68_gene4578 [Halteria grandinella]
MRPCKSEGFDVEDIIATAHRLVKDYPPERVIQKLKEGHYEDMSSSKITFLPDSPFINDYLLDLHKYNKALTNDNEIEQQRKKEFWDSLSFYEKNKIRAKAAISFGLMLGATVAVPYLILNAQSIAGAVHEF